VASKFTSADYLQAQRVRRRQTDHWRRTFRSCDYIVLPTTACVAPRIPDGAEISGECLRWWVGGLFGGSVCCVKHPPSSTQSPTARPIIAPHRTRPA